MLTRDRENKLEMPAGINMIKLARRETPNTVQRFVQTTIRLTITKRKEAILKKYNKGCDVNNKERSLREKRDVLIFY